MARVGSVPELEPAADSNREAMAVDPDVHPDRRGHKASWVEYLECPA